MCAICGCSGDDHHHSHSHSHPHDHDHHSHHDPSPRSLVAIERDVLAKNDRLAAQNRARLRELDVVAINFLSSPGAGKTTLLERMIRDIGSSTVIRVIEGDQATDRDAQRIRAAGARAVQVNTGAGCHLDAAMVASAITDVDPPRGALLAVENVGNLVCPALFDLGEQAKVVVASVTEGDDKPSKYPFMFRAGHVTLLNKVDLLAHVSFDVAAFEQRVKSVNPAARVIPVSATRGDGLEAFYAWVREQMTGVATA
ncbi:MAG: hydrogenase nickel incorporation protein HypB [Polyangiaceae bacterium]